MGNQLKPCPFCASAATLGPDEATGAPCVSCEGCGASTGLYSDDEAAVAAWNRRASEPSAATALAALRDYATEQASAHDSRVSGAHNRCDALIAIAYRDLADRLDAAGRAPADEAGPRAPDPLMAAYQEVTLSAMDLLCAVDIYGPTYVERMPPNLRTAVAELREAVNAADDLMPDLSADDAARPEPPRCTCPNRNRHDTRHIDSCPVAAEFSRTWDEATAKAASLAGHNPQTCQKWYGLPDCTCGAEAPADEAAGEEDDHGES